MNGIELPISLTDTIWIAVKILAIDTATSSGGVAVYDDETGALAEHMVAASARQFSESLMDMVDHCLRDLAIKISDIDCLAVTAGPGSFTGLRVGLSAVKGIAFATGKPVVTVSTLLAHAWMVPFHDGYVCPVLDARKKEVYSALFRWKDGAFETVVEEGAYRLNDILSKIDARTVFVGDGLAIYGRDIADVLGTMACLAPAHAAGALPAAVAVVGARKARERTFADAAVLSPVYLRKSEAELGSG